MSDWQIFTGKGIPHSRMTTLPPPPPWRRFADAHQCQDQLILDEKLQERFAKHKFEATTQEVEIVNAAIHLRRPLLVTGKPGTGKTTLAYAIAHELQLDKVLTWSITSRSVLKDALYQYDAIGRLQEANLRNQQGLPPPDIGDFIRLGPLGTALLARRYPRVLLIDEIDKSDIDLPNDLLHIFEEGRYEIPELTRLAKQQERAQATQAPEGEQPKAQAEQVVHVFQHERDERAPIVNGRVNCAAFPIVVMTSNGEREFPPPFLRRCIRLNILQHDKEKLTKIINSYFKGVRVPNHGAREQLIENFLKRREKGDLSTDQLLNAIYLTKQGFTLSGNQTIEDKDALIETILQQLSSVGS